VNRDTNLAHILLFTDTEGGVLRTFQFDTYKSAPLFERLFLLLRGRDFQCLFHEEIGTCQPLFYFV
jgi:hypothetical protein